MDLRLLMPGDNDCGIKQPVFSIEEMGVRQDAENPVNGLEVLS
jgi:hypothetical protein